MTDQYPNAGTYVDRHGKTRWRFRRKGKTITLPGGPGDPEFEAAYSAAVHGLPAPKPAPVVRLPTPAPRTLRACFAGVQRTAEWQQMAEASQRDQSRVAERFLSRPVVKEKPDTWGDMPVADLKRWHVKLLIGEMSDTPHAAGHVLRCIRKLIGYALDREWVETDPTHRYRYRPEMGGHRAWTDDERAKFEKRWPTGTTPRLVYALALWTGSRRGDLTRIAWADLEAEVLTIEHGKTGAQVVLDALPPLVTELEATPRRGDTVLVTAYGKPFSDKSLTGRFRDWTTAAGLDGCTLHGLRKTFGTMLADDGATTKMTQAALGHTTIQQAELYTVAADRRRAAKAAMALLKRRFATDG